MFLVSIVSTLLGLTVLVVISWPFFSRKRYGIQRDKGKPLLEELRSLCDAAQTEIQTLELEFELGYVGQIDYQRRIIQYRTSRDQLFSQLHLMASEITSKDNNIS